MSLLETWIRTPAAAALGKTLLHSLWQGAAVALVLALALCFIRSSRGRYAAGCIAIVSLLGIFALTFTRVMPGPVERVASAGAAGETVSELRRTLHPVGDRGKKPREEENGELRGDFCATIRLAQRCLFSSTEMLSPTPPHHDRGARQDFTEHFRKICISIMQFP